MSIAFLYAGQGSQRVGMGADFYAEAPAFAAVYDAARLSFDLKELSFNGPAETLNRTQYTQPAMVAFAIGVTDLLREEGITPDYVAGLSLGEYSALYAAGVFDAATALDLVAYRGQVMTEATAHLDCAMTAVLALDRDTLKVCCEEAAALGVVEIANYNCPGQLAIAGEAAAVERASALAKAAGARRCVPLKVSGPFHTSLMKPAGDALAKRFATTTFGPMTIPVLYNCLGDEKAPPDKIADLLERQVQHSVYMEDTIRTLIQKGVDTIIEIGPGKTLSGFVRKIDKTITTYAIDTMADYKKVLEAISHD